MRTLITVHCSNSAGVCEGYPIYTQYRTVVRVSMRQSTGQRGRVSIQLVLALPLVISEPAMRHCATADTSRRRLLVLVVCTAKCGFAPFCAACAPGALGALGAAKWGASWCKA